METTVTLSSKGQLALPKHLRQEDGLGKSDIFRLQRLQPGKYLLEKVTGNFIFLGVIAAIAVPQVPVTAMRLCVVNRWTAGIGQFTEVVRFIAPDQTTVVRQSQVKFALQDTTGNATNVTVFGQVKF